MKGFTLIAVIFGSIIGGAVGGYGAAQLAPSKADAPVRKAQVEKADAGEETSTNYADRDELKKAVSALESKISDLNKRLDHADKNAQDAAAMDKKLEDINATVAKMKDKVEKAPAASAEGAPVVAGGISQEDFDRYADAREKRREEERQAARDKEMQERTARRNAAIVENLDKKLQLQVEQKEKIGRVLEAQNAKFAELGKKAQEAREKGEQFDWRQEMQKLSNETLTLVRNELTPGQQAIFDEATKDSGMRAFEPQGGGFGPGGGQGGPGGGRGGRGGNGGGGN